MGSDPSTTIATDALLDSLVSGERGGKLRTQLAGRFPECSADQIEDALQYGCKSFLDEAEDVSGPGAIYKWIRTAAFRYLNREADRHRRELAVDPAEDGIVTFAADEPGPVEELIAQEDDADLAMLVEEVSSSLSDRRRDVLALYSAGYKRSQIADRLGLTERTVKRDIREIMDLARATLARFAGGGCDLGEPLVMRLACGISTLEEAAQAREHIAHCERCELFSEKLIAWREKVGAMLPAPVAEGVSPGVLERLTHKSAEGFSLLKQHVLDGGAQIKQHATTSYYRAVDPTPLAAARPGTVGAVIASCIAIGGGATYCAHEGIVDSIGTAAAGLVASESEGEPESAAAPPETQGPTYTPIEPPVEEVPAPESTSESPPSEPEPEPQPEPEPPPEQFEPSPQASEPAPEPEPEPAPVSPGSGPQFGGP